MVVCPHVLAAQVGGRILRQGGNAVDAAIATQAALGVVYPHMTGLGGDAFWLIYDAKTGALKGLNGSGRAAAQATPSFYASQGYSEIPQRGPLAAITVPGAVDSWHQAHQQFGRLAWASLLQPAIDLAETGYPATASQTYWTRRDRPYFRQHSPDPCPFLPEGNIPNPGDLLTNPDLAQTLRAVATEGAAVFYQGAIATQIADYLASVGGLLTGQDFATHRSDWVTPIDIAYRGYRVAELPPNSQGFTVLQMLNLIEPFDLQHIGHGTADYYHLMVEATKLAFADRDRWLTDPNFVEIPISDLISKAYSDRRRPLIQLDKAGTYLAGRIGGDTVYTAVVDDDGNAVSVIQSLYFDFGTAVVVPGTGFALQNRGAFFSLNPNHVNVLAPHKRTFHTLMPGMVLQPEGNPYLVFGTMGGEGQPQTQLALLTRTLDFQFDPQQAINQPRWLWGRTWGETATGLTLEGRISPEIRQALAERGHPVTAAPDWTEKMGHAHMIRCCPETGEYQGGCDPRSDGAAIAV
ncbi:MAG: gamma-glutamyltransferase [Leptolyngbya sp. SIO1E4]|nr:gamma-glutamyltransferase [Leptolyngbya sp. SIO1E4]